MTSNQQAYRKELRRIQAAQRRYKKQGYTFDPLPPMPKRVTAKKLRELELIRGRRVLNLATGWIDTETGEFRAVADFGRELITRAQKINRERRAYARWQERAERESKTPQGGTEGYTVDKVSERDLYIEQLQREIDQIPVADAREYLARRVDAIAQDPSARDNLGHALKRAVTRDAVDWWEMSQAYSRDTAIEGAARFWSVVNNLLATVDTLGVDNITQSRIADELEDWQDAAGDDLPF